MQVVSHFQRMVWFPAVHVLLFAVTWGVAFTQSQPILDGPARWGFAILFIADFPISLVAFSTMWGEKLVWGLSLWGVLGTAWWCFIGLWIYKRRTSTIPH
ncbi:MAG TPA: hypothetical protein VGF44_02175 [Terriglobales bacterium]|jgi:hypothetical protein